jgi:Tfp pilus assembly protein PilF
VRLALLPYGLNIDYAWQKACTWPLPDAAGTITWLPTEINGLGFARASAIVGGLLLLTLIALFRAPALGFLGGAFFTALAPTSSVAPIVDLCFEHRTYVALAPLLTLVVIAVRSGWVRISQRFGLSAAVTSAILEVAAWLAVATLVALTMVRNHDYRSELALWGDAAAKAPGNPRAQYNYGVYLQIAGETPQAIEQYLRTIELDPGYTDAYLNLGRIAVFEKRLEDADRHFNDLLEKAIPIEGYSQHLEAAQTLAQLRYDHDDLGMARYYLDRKFQFLDELLKHDPEHAEGLKSQAEARELLRKIEAALRRPPAAAPSGAPAPTSTSPTATSTARF